MVKFWISKIFDPVFVNLGEILATNIDISKALTIHISEYQSSCELIFLLLNCSEFRISSSFWVLILRNNLFSVSFSLYGRLLGNEF